MIYTQKIKDAIKFSIKTHEIDQKQKRKGKDIPYITHPLTVGLILTQAGASDEVIAAGILHDTIEDSASENRVTKEMLAEQFGEEVAELVDSVTEKKKELSKIAVRFQYLIPWEDRKSAAIEHIKDFSRESLLVKSADVLSNTTELIDDYNVGGDSVFDRFEAPVPKKENTLNNSIKVMDTILGCWPENPLATDLEEARTHLLKINNSGMMKNVLLAAYEEKDPSWHVSVFIVNTNQSSVDLTLAQHRIQSDDDTIVDLGMSDYKKITVPANGSIEIDRMNDIGALDFCNEYWVKDGEKQYLASVTGTSLYLGPRSKLSIPILNRVGYVEYFGK